jgi:hypothetical protein
LPTLAAALPANEVRKNLRRVQRSIGGFLRDLKNVYRAATLFDWRQKENNGEWRK